MKTSGEAYAQPRRFFLRILLSVPLAAFFRDTIFAVLKVLGVPAPESGIAYGAPQPVARLSQLSKPWSAVHFSYPIVMKDLEGEREAKVPGVVIRLPDEQAKTAVQQGVSGIKGNLYVPVLLCPHEKCVIFYREDRRELERELGVEARTPMISCPCHQSVFDLSQNGRPVKGPVRRRPWFFEFDVAGDEVVVSGVEKGSLTWGRATRVGGEAERRAR